MIQTTFIDYYDKDNVLLKGFYAYDDKIGHMQPIVLIVHDWSGNNPFAQQKAEQIAQLGLIGFAIDMYGGGKIGNTKEEKSALMSPLMQDRNKLKNRLIAAYDKAQTLPNGDKEKIAIIGFCFGGLCALDLARSGADIKAAVSFHGLLHAPDGETTSPIKAHILALHGFDDPMVTKEQTLVFADEMTRRKAEWQLHIYGNTMHGFTNPDANDPNFGTVFSPIAAKRAWLAMKNLFAEVF